MRYIIGIDLGTTNSSVAYVDSQSQNLQIQQFRIPQLVAPGYTEALTTLPSFCYLCASDEWPAGSLALPWKKEDTYFVGKLAQLHGAKVPTRLVQSAKSWLCHAAANRKEKILPFEVSEAYRISPIEASAKYLNHIKEAWNALIAKGDASQEFEEQEIVLTVPASFDEIARRLTAEAASLAGLKNLTLLEEPQATFYSWLAQNEAVWQKELPLGSRVLVCDIGGGTTDFSLIDVNGTPESPVLQRMAVGDHLLLGGDNMDAALASALLPELFTREASAEEWMKLKSEARSAKEALLSEGAVNEHVQLTLQGSGASVIQKTQTTHVSRQKVTDSLLSGFFGQYSWENAIQIRKASGIRTMGLPYETEPSITKHLARFLLQSAENAETVKGPDFILFNGGTMKPRIFQEAIVQNLRSWFPHTPLRQLSSYHLDLAVARGAAYYGKVRRGIGVRISGGTARGFYLQLEVQNAEGALLQQALTLLPRGSEEGSTYEPQHTFMLRPNVPVSFQLYTSHVRLGDHSGDLIPVDLEELQPLPRIHTQLRFGKKTSGFTDSNEMIPVHLRVHLNAIGTLEMTLKSQKTDHVWALEFQIRTASGQENTLATLGQTRKDELFDLSHLNKAKEVLESFYFNKSALKAEKLIEMLEQQLEMPKKDWPPSVLRGLSDTLLKLSADRKISLALESRWWNLSGFLLIPGSGYPLDDFRIKDLWKIILSEAKVHPSPDVQIQKWICYRRVASGLNKGQQLQLAHELLPLILSKKNGKIEVKGKAEYSQYAEKIRAFASLELIDLPTKEKVGAALIERLTGEQAISAEYWALARIGARHLFYGSTANVIRPETCGNWIESLLKVSDAHLNQREFVFLISQLARKTDLRELNLSEKIVDKVLKRFMSAPEYEQIKKIVAEVSPMTQTEQDQIFGEHLPTGLSIYNQ